MELKDSKRKGFTIPKKFKIGNIEYNVELKDSIELRNGESDDYFCFGKTDSIKQKIELATKDENGDDLSKERIKSVFFHELVHSIFDEMAASDLSKDEQLVQFTSKCIESFIDSYE